jgi:hypothetical protein
VFLPKQTIVGKDSLVACESKISFLIYLAVSSSLTPGLSHLRVLLMISIMISADFCINLISSGVLTILKKSVSMLINLQPFKALAIDLDCFNVK